MLPWLDPYAGMTPYLPTLMSPTVSPFADGTARVPQPSALACIQLRSRLPARIIDRRSRTRSSAGVMGVSMSRRLSRRRATLDAAGRARRIHGLACAFRRAGLAGRQAIPKNGNDWAPPVARAVRTRRCCLARPSGTALQGRVTGGRMRLRTILCPVDFSDLSAKETEVAVAVAREFGGRMVLHHDCAAIAPGIARAWDWEATHQKTDGEAQAERRMQAALNALPRDVRAEGVVSAGPVAGALLAVAEELSADLIVLGSHGWSTETHASVTERVIAEAPCPVLTFNEGAVSSVQVRLPAAAGAEPPIVVVPTGFSPTAAHAVRYAWALARALPIRVHLLHAIPRATPDDVRSARVRLAALRLADASVPVDVHVRA